MSHGCSAPDTRSAGARSRYRRRAGVMLLVLSAVTAGASACTNAQAGEPHPHPGSAATSAAAPLSARTRWPAPATQVLTGATAASAVAGQLFVSAPVVVVADENRPAAVAAAAGQAAQVHAPLLLTAAGPGAGTQPPGSPPGSSPASGPAHPRTDAVRVTSAWRTEIEKLHPRAVLAVGLSARALAARLPGIRVVTGRAVLPATTAPPQLSRVAVLVRADRSAATMAVTVTAQVAGGTVIPVNGDDPRADPAAVSALWAAQPREVLAVGSGFGPAWLASRVAVAMTGVQLPGGGQVLFPGRRLAALYGHPGAPALGVLGGQGLAASIARARQVAAPYRALSDVPVVPAFEIIATVAQASPGPDGSYSYQSSVASLRPWVRRATAAGFYVVLDLQPGRADLLGQAKRYEPLLRLPSVGLALDAEWKLQPGQLPLRQIGSVGISEVNSVVSWLATLTAEHHLPQKLLVLHQFRLSMIRGERDLDTSHDDLAILIHMDGQGTPAMKQQTWNAVTAAAPPGVFFGWKNFYVKDHPTLSPRQTMAKTPKPVMISYQ